MDGREKYINRGKGADFRTAVQHMDEYISDETVKINYCSIFQYFSIQNVEIFQKFRAHAYAKPIDKKVKVKTENDIENILGIKLESPIHSAPTAPQAKIRPDAAWKREKQKLIEQMISLKSENLTIVRKLHENDAELNSVTLTKQALEHKLSEMQTDFGKKIEELQTRSQSANDKNARQEKTISDLKRENNLLVSQRKQLNAELARNEHQNEKQNSDDDDENVFEVESLLDDKVIAENHYLVRWKGFDSSHDSWVRESNLCCPSILKTYKQLKKKK